MDTIDTTTFVRKLKTFPLGRILFITVRDPKQSPLWCKLGKVNDWVRRYSNNYFIVKGTHGGIHFHIIAGLIPNRVPKPVKGIHFHIQDLTSKKEKYPRDDAVEESRRYDNHIAECIVKSMIIRLGVPPQCQELSAMVKSFFRKKKNRETRTRALTRKEQDIENLINYQAKNLEEPRDTLGREKYLDYLLVC